MRKKTKDRVSILILIAAILIPLAGLADNPIVQTYYTTDPAPMVYNDTLYLYTGHDENNSTNFVMKNWRCFSTTDMVNWTDHGSPLSLTTFIWAKSDAWAGQCIERNGKFYWYVPVTETATGSMAIGVAVSDHPTGPFVDALGHPLISRSEIDPTVFIDDDGQAYLYYGNPDLYYVKLNKDMISYSGSSVKVPLTTSGFGTRYNNATRATLFEEAPWLCKRNNLYYMLYAAGGVPENIAYSTSTTATGPWVFQDTIMPTQGASFTNHEGIIDFKGHSYFFYHNGALPGGGGFDRSVCAEEFTYNPDGTIPTINMTTSGLSPIRNLNPYLKTEAETICWEEGVETSEDSTKGVYVTDIDKGDYIKVKSVDFGSIGAGLFTANISCSSNGGTVELHLDSKTGPTVGILPICYTGGDKVWKDEVTSVTGAIGVHDLYFVFNSVFAGKILNMNSWQFTEKGTQKQLFAINATSDSYKIDILSGSNTTGYLVQAIYTDGTKEDITTQAQVSISSPGILNAMNGTITGLNYGPAIVVVSYSGKLDSMAIMVKSIASELTLKNLTISSNSIFMLNGDSNKVIVNAEYLDGHITDITLNATVENLHPEVVEFVNGVVKSKRDGNDTIKFSYKGELGTTQNAGLIINVQTFPLTQALFNPSIYSVGTFNENTLELKTGQYGFGGWHYANGIDISMYKYLVVDLVKPNTCGATFRLFDEDNYWGASASYDFGAQKRLIVNLGTMIHSDTKTSCNASHLYIIGFWTLGGTALPLKDIYLTNSDTYINPTAIEDVYTEDLNKRVDVYSLMGVRLLTGVKRADAIASLKSGVYIVDKQKIIIMHQAQH